MYANKVKSLQINFFKPQSSFSICYDVKLCHYARMQAIMMQLCVCIFLDVV